MQTMKRLVASALLTFSMLSVATSRAPLDGVYWVGAGVYDITGPVADVMMMGYVDLKQTTNGIHTRLRSRAFVIREADSNRRVAIVTIDQMSVADAITTAVLEKLQARYGSLYTNANTLIAATHTHSAPGGYSHYVLYDTFSSKGFSQQNFNVIVEGIYQSIVEAHQNLAPATIAIGTGDLDDASISRSRDAYLLNPVTERRRHSHDVDKTMTLLKFTGIDGTPIGVINWFAVHATSMKKTNRLISADNKGYAALLFEKIFKNNHRSHSGFVAAFANSNAGDVSPSSGGADVDENGDWICALRDNFKCTELLAKKQFAKARELYNSPNELLTGKIDYRHSFVDMSDVRVGAEFANTLDGKDQQTCFAAIGLSMLAGTKDGWGVGREKQKCSDPSLLGGLPCAFHSCHGEKPVVLATGMKKPYPWTPQILPLQILRLGSLAIVAVPAEFTTMSGRRLRQTVEASLANIGVRRVVIAGYANSYAGYVATREEYQMQNYEGASTHFGEWTLAAYQQEFSNLATAMVEQREVEPGPAPLDTRKMAQIKTPLLTGFDLVPAGLTFGALATDANPSYRQGDAVSVQFWGANPNNDLMIESSFLEVQIEIQGRWNLVADDGEFATRFIWQPQGMHKGLATLEWSIPKDQPPGKYRIFHRGTSSNRRGQLTPYQNASSVFDIQ